MNIESAIPEILPALGLNEYELRLYAAAVELGRASANRLAKKTGVPRTSAYSALERLQEKGLMIVEATSGVRSYLPANPESLVSLAEKQVSRAQEALAKAKEVSALLASARGRDAMASSKVLIFEGAAAVRRLNIDWAARWRESLLTFRRPWSGFQDDSFLKHYGDLTIKYWETFRGDRNEALNQLRIFSEDGPAGKQVEKRIASIAGERRKLRTLPGINNFSATLWIVGEYLILLKTRSNPHYALQVRDQLLAENVYAIFDKLWQLTE